MKGTDAEVKLREAVLRAYDLFGAAPPDRWAGDDLGLAREDWARLSAVPLRELNRADTNHFLSETGHFTRREVRYMLPRVMELLAEGEAPHAAGEECSLRCLRLAGYPDDWTVPEREVVESFLAALLDASLADERLWDRFSLDTVLCMAANANGDLGALLARADRAGDRLLARAVAYDLDWIGGLDTAGGLRNAFWESADDAQRAAVTAWYRRPEFCDRVERAFFAEGDPDWQRRLSDAAEQMRNWQRQPASG